MKIAAHAKIEEFLVKTEDGEFTIGVRQAREGENEIRFEMFKDREQVVRENQREMIYRQSLNVYKLRRLELFLTLAYVTGLIDDATGKELFTSGSDKRGQRRVSVGMTEKEFYEALALLPSAAVDAMSNFVYKVNPDWGNYEEPVVAPPAQAEAPSEPAVEEAVDESA